MPPLQIRKLKITHKDGDHEQVALLWCPGCGGVGSIDQDQLEGRVSVSCSCGAHFYIRGGEAEFC